MQCNVVLLLGMNMLMEMNIFMESYTILKMAIKQLKVSCIASFSYSLIVIGSPSAKTQQKSTNGCAEFSKAQVLTAACQKSFSERV